MSRDSENRICRECDVTVSVGTRLGPYEIVTPIDAGGMGEVYRARDRKLGRDVALKILPDTFVSDPERDARFEREARTLAAHQPPPAANVIGASQRLDLLSGKPTQPTGLTSRTRCSATST